MADDKVVASRAHRAARITGAAAAVAARGATARVLSAGAGGGQVDGGFSNTARQAAAIRQQLKAAESLVKVFSGMRGAGHYNQLRTAEGFERLKLPAEHFVLMRSIFLLIGLLGQLRSTNAWFDIAAEWLFGSEPVTELGREEQEFFAGRYDYNLEVTV